MTLLTKDQILSADDLDTEDIEVPEWNGTVRLRGMTGTERDKLEFQIGLARNNGSPEVDIRAGCVGKCLLNENDDRLFTDGEIRALGGKSGAVLDRLFDIVRNKSGMTDENLKAAARNLGLRPNGASRSD